MTKRKLSRTYDYRECSITLNFYSGNVEKMRNEKISNIYFIDINDNVTPQENIFVGVPSEPRHEKT